MSPTTVELVGKKTNSDFKVMFPTTDTVEQPNVPNVDKPTLSKGDQPTTTKGVQPKRAINTKKYKYFASVVLISVVLIAAIVFGSIALHHHLSSKQTDYDTETIYKGHHIPEHAHVDYNNKITYVNTTGYDDVVSAHNVQDYKRQLLVCKDVEGKVCYIDRLYGTFEEGLSRLAKKKVSGSTPVNSVIKLNQQIDTRILRKFAGDAIADHCKETPAYWVIDGHPKPKDGMPSNTSLVISCHEIILTVYDE